jgi:hypothetical protein
MRKQDALLYIPLEVPMKKQHWLLGEVSKGFDELPHRIVYFYTTRKLPEPRLRLGGKRVFDLEDVRRLEAVLGKKWKCPEVSNPM